MDKAGIDLRRLRYFIAVCDHSGFSRAANSIGIAQPALTRQIKLLEKDIGIPLINRSGRGAEPTDAGRLLLNKSRQYIDGLDSLVRDLRQKSSTLSGHLALGICPTVAPFFLDDVVGYVRDNHPNLTLSVIQAYSGDLRNLMGRNKLDLSLTYRPSTADGSGSIDLFSERLVLVTGHSPSPAGRALTLAQVARKKLILPSAIHDLRRIIDRVYSRRGMPLKPELELDSFDAIHALLLKSSMHYSSILPCHSIRRPIGDQQLSIFDIDDSDMQRTIAVVVPRGGRKAQKSAFLVDYICQRSSGLKGRLAPSS